MKGKDLFDSVEEVIEEATIEKAMNIIKERQQEIRRIQRLLNKAQKDFDELLEMDIEDIVEEYSDDFEY